MPKIKKFFKNRLQLYRPFVVTALLVNGIFQFIAPVMADGTAAGQSISNTATATYEDPKNPNTTINATSNTVVVTVAEVAGITIAASGITFKTDTDGQGGSTPDGKINIGDTLYYTYTIKNVGNDPTKFRIPNVADITGPGKVNGNLEINYDGGNPNSWQEISNGELITKSIPPDGTVLVRVPVLVTNGAKTDDLITVKIGDTPSNAQNQLRQDNGGDVYTVDNDDPPVNVDPVTGEVKGSPSNGVREASMTQQVKVGGIAQAKALATILKTHTNHNPGDLTKLDDDLLSYGLTLKVEASDPTNSGIIPAPLAGTNIQVDNSNVTRILVSDAIPVGMVLDPNNTPTAPNGWQVVYTTSDLSITANQADWKTTKPTAGTITRVGFITKVETSLAPGTTVSGFLIPLKSNVTTKTVIFNLAQLFGQTAGDPPNTPPIYDESGDQNPTNFNPDDKTFTPFNPQTDKGDVQQPTDPTDANNNGIPDQIENTVGIDQNNNNTGSGSSGEANTFILQNPAATSVLSGPQNVPDAVGPNNDNNKDFTNKSALIEANTPPGAKIDPPGVSFTNTLLNTGANPANISLVPIALPNNLDLPDKTQVTISKGGLSATYVYDQPNNKFVFVSGQGTVNGQPISATNPIQIDNVKPGEKVDFGVEINLPPNTPLSTDTVPDYTGDNEFGFPVPIAAYIDSGTPGLDPNDAQNVTIDKVYTGYLKLLKESRVLQGSGPAVLTGQGDFDDQLKTPAPGNILEYRIRYKNISDPQAGTGNVILNADKVVITEDGTSGGNNWALDNDKNGDIDTSNVVGSAKDSGSATINFFNGNPATTAGTDQSGKTVNTDVTKYVNTVSGAITPGQERTFSFQRLVNGSTNAGQ